MSDQPPDPPVRRRREPPPLRTVTVLRTAERGPRLRQITLGGPAMEGFALQQAAASVRVLLPSADDALVLPAWNGNEFLLPDGRRPILRTLTPRRFDPAALELDVEIVLHGGGAASMWAAAVAPGSAVAVSGPGRGYEIDPEAPSFLLAGDETALAAIGQLLEHLPASAPVDVHLEVAHPDGRVMLPDHPRAVVTWHDLVPGGQPGAAMVAAVEAAELPPGTRVWVAGEAAAVQRIRQHLFVDRGLPRTQATVRGYWKRGQAGETDD